jgi:hypothetical protein
MLTLLHSRAVRRYAVAPMCRPPEEPAGTPTPGCGRTAWSARPVRPEGRGPGCARNTV